jgi:hypothetical protein
LYHRLGLPRHLLYTRFLLGLFSTLKMDVILFSETSVHIQTARNYVPEDGIIENNVSDTGYISVLK